MEITYNYQLLKLYLHRFSMTRRKIVRNNGGEQLVHGILSEINENQGWIKVYLTPPDIRPLSTAKFVKKWRKMTGQIAGLELPSAIRAHSPMSSCLMSVAHS